MKLLVSDYDDTIKITNLLDDRSFIPLGTIKKIKDFRKNGNIFMISTARPYDSIMYEINSYNIPYDFVSALNGTIIYDNMGRVIYSKDMVQFCIEELKKNYSYIDKIKGFKHNDKYLYYFLYTKFLRSTRGLIRYLKSYNVSVYNRFYNTLHIVSPISDKVDTVKFMQELLNIDKEDVITIGDDYNDINMIKDYNGYSVIKFPLDIRVLKSSKKHVKSLNDALSDINKNI